MKINEVKINAGRRTVDVKKVKELSESIKELGLLNPITVNEDGTLIAGMHRLEACKLLGHEEIKVNKINLNLLLAELAEIDENLIRNELHWLESDKQLKRRKAIYEELHPDTSHGGDRKSEESKRHNVVLKTFTKDTADKLGESQRSIQRSVARAEKIIEEVEDDIKELDITKTEGTILARFEPEQQKKIIEFKKQKTDSSIKEIVQEIKKEEKKVNYEQNKAEFEKEIKITNINQIIILGDSIEILPTLKNDSFDLLLSDPPYGMDFKSGWNNKEKIANDKIEDTITLFEEVLKNSVPLLKDNAHFYLFGNIDFLPEIKPIIEKYLNLKSVLIWDRKVIGMGDLRSYGFSYDIIYFGYNKVWKDLNGTRDRDILQFNRVTPAANIHPTEKPLDLLEYLIKKSSNENDKILEPFAGGGSTLIACKNTNRMATGIEIEEQYFNLIKKRI